MGLIQCLAATSGRWIARMADAGRSGSPQGSAAAAGEMAMGGFPDSCYMWRSGGHLQQAREKTREFNR